MTIHVKVKTNRVYLGDLLLEVETTNSDYPNHVILMSCRFAADMAVQKLKSEIDKTAKLTWAMHGNPEWQVPGA